METEFYTLWEAKEKLSYSSGVLRPESGERAFTVARIVKDGRVGTALVEGTDETAGERAEKLALELSRLSPREDYHLPEGTRVSWGRSLKDSLFEHVEEIREAVALVEGSGVNVAELEIGLIRRKTSVWSTKGTDVSGEYGIVDFAFSLTRGKAFLREWMAFPEVPDVKRLMLESAEMLKKAESVEKAQPGEARVLFAPLPFAELLYLGIVREASGSLMARGLSSLEEGQRVAGEGFTLYDDPMDETSLKPAKADDEGIPTKRRAVIEDGVFTGHLWNSYWAHRTGRESTGNALRYETALLEAPHHLTLKGDASLEEMLEELGDGYLIAGIMGLTGVDSKTGNFSVLANPAFVVRGGDVVASTSFTITGNVRDLFEEIELIGKDRKGIWFEPISMAFTHVLGRVKVVP